MNTMEKKLLILVFLLAISGLSWSQYPLAAGCPHGIFIFLTNRIPADGYIQVSRTAGDGNRESLVATVEAPKSIEDLTDRVHRYEPLFSDLGHYSESDIRRMWDYLSNNRLIDTLPPVNYPVMHLAAGTAWLDQQADSSVAYTYSISYYRKGRIADTKKTNPVTLPVSVDLPVPEFHSRNVDVRKIYIDWLVKEDPYLYSFRVYRRRNMAGNFEKIEPERGFYNQGDSLFLVMNDRHADPRTVYEYFLEPLDRLGNAGQHSDPVVVSGFTQQDIPVIRRFDAGPGEGDHVVRLYWNFSHRELVRSVGIFRSMVYDSAYRKIAEVPPADSVYIDHVPGAMENYYYYIVLQGIMQKSYPSARVGGRSLNTRKPGRPSEVAAVPAEGGVRVYWTHENPVISGYYVYRDQGLNDSLHQISGYIPAELEMMSYLDSSAALQGNHTYRYAVVSVNDGYQLSDLSDTVSARPDIATRVMAPSNLHGGVLDRKVMLVWDDMNREDEFLAGYNIYRRVPGGAFQKINPSLQLFNNNTFTDSTVKAGSPYQYAVTSVDESGSESDRSTSVSVQIPGLSETPFAPGGLAASRSETAVVLTWQPESVDEKSKITVYRHEAGQQPKPVASVGGEAFRFEDSDVTRDHLYFYYLTVTNTRGIESEPGRTVSIRF